MSLRLVGSLVLVLAAACGSTATSAEPTEPARDVGTTSAEPAEPAGGTGTTAATLDPRLVEMIERMERFVTALEGAGGDCDRTADAIMDFADSDDGKAMRRATRDDELLALVKAHHDEVLAARPLLESRFDKAISTCIGTARFERALDESQMFVKRRADGTRVDDEGADD